MARRRISSMAAGEGGSGPSVTTHVSTTVAPGAGRAADAAADAVAGADG